MPAEKCRATMQLVTESWNIIGRNSMYKAYCWILTYMSLCWGTMLDAKMPTDALPGSAVIFNVWMNFLASETDALDVLSSSLMQYIPVNMLQDASYRHL